MKSVALDGSVRAYFTGVESWTEDLMNDLGPTPSFDAALIERLGAAADQLRGRGPLRKLQEWRDDGEKPIFSDTRVGDDAKRGAGRRLGEVSGEG